MNLKGLESQALVRLFPPAAAVAATVVMVAYVVKTIIVRAPAEVAEGTVVTVVMAFHPVVLQVLMLAVEVEVTAAMEVMAVQEAAGAVTALQATAVTAAAPVMQVREELPQVEAEPIAMKNTLTAGAVATEYALYHILYK